MSGTGVQSAMRRRMRPPDDQRQRQDINNTGSNKSNSQSVNRQNVQNQINPIQILHSHELRLKVIETKIENNSASSASVNIMDNKTDIDKLKADIDSSIEKKLNIVSNNLNFLLSSLNDERGKVKRLEIELVTLKDENNKLTTRLNEKLDEKTFLEYKQDLTNSKDVETELMTSDKLENGTESTETIGTMESLELKDDLVEQTHGIAYEGSDQADGSINNIELSLTDSVETSLEDTITLE